MKKSKRGMSSWIWILIILILLAVGIGVYFWLSGDGSSILGSGNSIPQPPALPN
jgi:flagellar basal body-associated protein FliL